MKLKFLLNPILLFSLLASVNSFAEKGGINGGGGEPAANHALRIAKNISAAFSKGHISLPVTKDGLDERVREIEARIDSLDPYVIFQSGDEVNCFGVTKLGCFKNKHIYFGRDGWDKATEATRVEAMVMELVISLGGKGRYKAAEVATAVLFGFKKLSDSEIKALDYSCFVGAKMSRGREKDSNRYAIIPLRSVDLFPVPYYGPTKFRSRGQFVLGAVDASTGMFPEFGGPSYSGATISLTLRNGDISVPSPVFSTSKDVPVTEIGVVSMRVDSSFFDRVLPEGCLRGSSVFEIAFVCGPRLKLLRTMHTYSYPEEVCDFEASKP